MDKFCKLAKLRIFCPTKRKKKERESNRVFSGKTLFSIFLKNTHFVRTDIYLKIKMGGIVTDGCSKYIFFNLYIQIIVIVCVKITNKVYE